MKPKESGGPIRVISAWRIAIAAGALSLHVWSAEAGQAPISTGDAGEVQRFEKAAEERYALPIPYRTVRSAIQELLGKYERSYLQRSWEALPQLDAKGNRKLACRKSGSDEIIRVWSWPQNWPALGYLGSVYYFGSRITSGDPLAPDLAGASKAAALRVADHMIAYANAKRPQYEFVHPLDGKMTEATGWNNFASSWDGWNNGTCSGPDVATAFASGWALVTLANAYRLSGDLKYMHEFYRGAAYWHRPEVSGVFKPGYEDYEAIRSRLNSVGGPVAVMAGYTVGGFSASTDHVPDHLVIRYHYHLDDPGQYSTGYTSLIAFSMLTAGLAYPDGSFAIAADSKGALVRRSFSNIGWWSMYGIHMNLARGNFSYHDIGSIRYRDTRYEAHVDFTIHFLAKAGAMAKNQHFLDTARKAVLTLLDQGAPLSRYGYCANRQLDERVLRKCQEILRSRETPLDPYYLFAAIAQLEM